MKKIITLLMLSALFFVPKRVQAVRWEVSDGTQYRINPNNPSDPNDSVRIPAGTKFVRIMCGLKRDRYSNYEQVVILENEPYVNAWSSDEHVFTMYASLSGTIKDINTYSGYSYGPYDFGDPNLTPLYNRLIIIPNFDNDALRLRLAERIYGYNYLRITYGGSMRTALSCSSKIRISSYGRNREHEYFSTLDAVTLQQRIRYLYKIVLTEDEVLNTKTLNFDPQEYGISSSYVGIRNIRGLEIFQNLEELILANNRHFAMMEDQYTHNDHGTTSFYPDFTPFSKLKVLDLSGINGSFDNNSYRDTYVHFRPLEMPTLPSSLEYLYLRNSNVVQTLLLNGTGNPNLKEIDATGSGTLETLEAKGCPELDAVLVTNCSNLRVLNCDSGNLTELDLTGCSLLRELYCYDNMLETLTFDSNTSYSRLERVECQNNNLTSLSYNSTNNIRSLNYLDCSKNIITNLELPYANELKQLYCWNNKIPSLDLSASTNLWRLRMSNNKVKSLDLTNNRKLKEIYANNNLLTTLDCSNLTYLQEAQLSRNKMTNLDMSGCSSVKKLLCNAQGGDNVRLLDTLNLTGCTALTTLECQNNALTSLNLSTCTRLTPSGVKAYMQRAVKDVKVFDRNKVCIELPNGVTPTIANNSTITDTHMDQYFGTWTGSGFDKTRNKVIKRDGKTYLVLHDISDDARGGAQTKADVDFYGKQMKYQYALFGDNWDETLGGSLANGKKTDNVTVTTYPYVMYVNPTSADIHSVGEGNAPFYSGTIYLDYDAIVPEGTTVYIAKKIKIRKEEIYSTPSGGHEKVVVDQLQLVPLVPGEGATEVVIPAYTPVYVKSATETGLFSFDRNNHGGVAQPLGVAEDGSDLIANNIFKGVLTDSTGLAKYSVLALGRGRPAGSDDSGYTAQSRIGFWPSSRTVIPAHRAFIPIEELEKAGVNNSSPGLLFSFTNDIDENTTTGIRTAASAKKNEGWYTINGVRLTGRPTEKGVYIHNGRKEVIR